MARRRLPPTRIPGSPSVPTRDHPPRPQDEAERAPVAIGVIELVAVHERSDVVHAQRVTALGLGPRPHDQVGDLEARRPLTRGRHVIATAPDSRHQGAAQKSRHQKKPRTKTRHPAIRQEAAHVVDSESRSADGGCVGSAAHRSSSGHGCRG